jgi:hypothetical protein
MSFYQYTDKYRVRPNGKGGFSISRDGMNPMPGATSGFKSHRDALVAIQCLEHCGGDIPGVSDRFWDLYHRVSGVTQRERDFRNKTAKAMGYKIVRLGRHSYQWEKVV